VRRGKHLLVLVVSGATALWAWNSLRPSSAPNVETTPPVAAVPSATVVKDAARPDIREPIEPEPAQPEPAPRTTNGTLIVRVTPPPGVVLTPDALAGSEVKVWFDSRRPKLPPELVVELGGLEPGHHAVRVHVPGFTPMERSFELAREERLELEFTLDAGLTLRGRVVDPDGKPIYPAGVSLSCWPVRPGPSVNQSDSVDERGEFELLGVTPGWIVLHAGWRGFHGVRLELGELTYGDSRDDLEIVLGLGNELGGIVRLPDGTPASRAKVKLTSADSEEWENEARCDSAGRFLFRGLPQGRVSVRSWIEPEEPAGSPFDEEYEEALADHYVACPRAWLEAETGRTDLEVRLEEPGRVEVHFSGTPEAHCTVFDLHGQLVWKPPTMFDGHSEPDLEFPDASPGTIEILGLTSGTYWLELSAWGHEPRTPADLLVGASVTLRSGAATQVELRLEPSTWVWLVLPEALESFPEVTVRSEGSPPRRPDLGYSLPVERCGVQLARGTHTLSIRHGDRHAELTVTVNGEPEREFAVAFD
jgi:hypothetical protein